MALIQLKHIKFYNIEKNREVLIGLMMDDLRGRVDGSEIVDFVNKNYNQGAK